MAKKFSHNHGQPRNLQHYTQIIKKGLTQNTHTNIETKKVKPTDGRGGCGYGGGIEAKKLS